MNTFGDDFINGFLTMGYIFSGNINDNRIIKYLDIIHFFEYRRYIDNECRQRINKIIEDMLIISENKVFLDNAEFCKSEDDFVNGILVFYKLILTSKDYTEDNKSLLKHILDILYIHRNGDILSISDLTSTNVKKFFEHVNKYLKTFDIIHHNPSV